MVRVPPTPGPNPAVGGHHGEHGEHGEGKGEEVKGDGEGKRKADRTAFSAPFLMDAFV